MFASICVENCLHVVNEGKHLCLFSKMRNIPVISKLLNRQEWITSETAVMGYLCSKIYLKEEAVKMPWFLNGSSGAESLSQHAKDRFNGFFNLKEFKSTSQENTTTPLLHVKDRVKGISLVFKFQFLKKSHILPQRQSKILYCID